LILLFLAFAFGKELYYLKFSMCFFLLLSPSFIGAVQLGFHATFMLSAIVVLSEYGGIRDQRVSHAFTFQNYPYFLALSVCCPLSLCIVLSARDVLSEHWPLSLCIELSTRDTLSEQLQIFNLLLGLYFVFLRQLFTKHHKFINF